MLCSLLLFRRAENAGARETSQVQTLGTGPATASEGTRHDFNSNGAITFAKLVCKNSAALSELSEGTANKIESRLTTARDALGPPARVTFPWE